MISVFVVRVPIGPIRPVRGIVTPFSIGWFVTASSVSPCGTCHTISPVVEIDGGDAAPWRFDERQPLDRDRARHQIAAGAPPPPTPVSPPPPVLMKSMSDRFGSFARMSRRVSVFEYTYRIPVSGSYEPPGQFAPFAMYAVPILPPSPRAIGRREERTQLDVRRDLLRLSKQLGREVDQVFFLNALKLERRRLGRKRLRRRIPFARHGALFDGLLDNRPHGLSGLAIEDVEEALLARHRGDLPGFAVYRDVGQDRRARKVEVPDAVVDELKVPLALPGVQVDRHQRLGEQVVARPVAAVVIAGRELDRQVHGLELFVHREWTPHAGVARVRPGVVLPGLVAELSGLRNGVEDPQALSGLDVEPADVALRVRPAARRCPAPMRGADDHHVLGDDGSGVQADFAGDRIEHLVVVLLEIEDAVLAERADRNPGLRVERDELIPDRHHEDALVALAVRPVRHTASRQQARGRCGALAFVDPVHPQQLTRRGIDGDGVAPRSDRGVEHAVDHQRRRLKVVVRADAEDIGLESPRDLQLAEVVRR